VQKGVGQQAPHLAVQHFPGFEDQGVGERAQAPAVRLGEAPLPGEELDHKEADVDEDQVLTHLAPFGEGSQEAGPFAAVVLAVVDPHARLPRQVRTWPVDYYF
jgi:hypothetical protein